MDASLNGRDTRTPDPRTPDPRSIVRSIAAAVNRHDLEGLTDCFSVDYVNETPAHPGIGFQGRSRVRSNWERIFAAVPDIRAELLDMVASGNSVWSEWEHRGTRTDGTPHLMRGIIIFTIAGNTASGARFYLEPVDAHLPGTGAAPGPLFGIDDATASQDRP